MFSCLTKLAKLLCLKCLGRMCFVNFSFYTAVSVGHLNVELGTTTHFQHNKAVTVIPPPYYVLVCRVFEHSISRISTSGRIASTTRSRRTCTTFEPATRLAQLQERTCSIHIQNRSNCSTPSPATGWNPSRIWLALVESLAPRPDMLNSWSRLRAIAIVRWTSDGARVRELLAALSDGLGLWRGRAIAMLHPPRSNRLSGLRPVASDRGCGMTE